MNVFSLKRKKKGGKQIIMFNKSSAAIAYSEIVSGIASVTSLLKQLWNCSERSLASVFPRQKQLPMQQTRVTL